MNMHRESKRSSSILERATEEHPKTITTERWHTRTGWAINAQCALMSLIIAAFGLASSYDAHAQRGTLSDNRIQEILIAESISSYPGNCPCPYSRASDRSRCGGRSAHSRPGGREPLCYAEDVSRQMIADYRRTSSR